MPFIGQFDASMIQTLDEFNRRYIDSWLEIKTKRVSDVFKYRGSDEDGRCLFWNPDYGDIRLKSNTMNKVNSFFPPIGLFNIGGHRDQMMFCYKFPYRQNRRSCNDKTIRFQHIASGVLHESSKGPSEEEFYRLIKASLDPLFPTSIRDALDRVKYIGSISCALNREYGLVKMDEDTYFLCNNLTPIGKLHKGTLVVDPHYYQEVSDYLRDSRQNINLEKGSK